MSSNINKEVLSENTGLFSGFKQRKVIAQLSKNTTDKLTIGILAEFIDSDGDHKAKAAAIDALMSLRTQTSIDYLCEHWLKSQSESVWKIIQDTCYIPKQPMEAVVLCGLFSNDWSRFESADRAMAAVLISTLQSCDDKLRSKLIRAFSYIKNWDALSYSTEQWLDSRDQRILECIESSSIEIELCGTVEIWYTLLSQQMDNFAACSTIVTEQLIEMLNDEDHTISKLASQALNRIENPEAVEVICDRFIKDMPELDDLLRDRSIKLKSLPSQVLILFLLERWEEYESADPDCLILRQEFSEASFEMQKRILTACENSKKVMLFEYLFVHQIDNVISKPILMDLLWRGIICAYENNEDRSGLWKWVKIGPACWSVPAIQLMSKGELDLNAKISEIFVSLSNKLSKVPASSFQGVRHYSNLEDRANAACFTLDTVGVISAGNNSCNVWNLNRREIVGRAPVTVLHGSNFCVALAPNHSVFASGGADSILRLWEFPQAERVSAQKLNYTSGIFSLDFTSDSNYLVAGGRHYITLWSIPDLNLSQEKTEALGNFHGVQVSYDRSIVASFAKNIVPIMTFPDLETINYLEHEAEVTAIAFNVGANSPSLLASGTKNGDLVLWTLEDYTRVTTWSGHSGAIEKLEFLESYLVSVAYDGTVKTWTIPDHQLQNQQQVFVDDWCKILSYSHRDRLGIATSRQAEFCVTDIALRNLCTKPFIEFDTNDIGTIETLAASTENDFERQQVLNGLMLLVENSAMPD